MAFSLVAFYFQPTAKTSLCLGYTGILIILPLDKNCMYIIQYLYMITTVNISLPKHMYDDAKKILADRGYASLSELVRDALRDVLYPKLTENGFTPEFEEQVLESAKEPVKNDIVLKSDKDIDDYFRRLINKVSKKKKHG